MILVKFNQSGARLRDPEADVRGMQVKDVNGQNMGHVSDFYFDMDSKKVRLMEITSGGFLGLGESQFLIDAADVKRMDGSLTVDKTHDEIMAMPRDTVVTPVETSTEKGMTGLAGMMGTETRPMEPSEPFMGMRMINGEERPGKEEKPTETRPMVTPAMGRQETGHEHKETYQHMAPERTKETPQRMIAGQYEDLLGKVTTHRVKAADGTLIIDKGEKISAHYLSKAEKHNAINDLRNSVEKRHM